MDMQRMLDAVMESGRRDRSKYHLTLDAAIRALTDAEPALPVQLESGEGVGHVDSYRGYYADLAFQPQPMPVPVREVLANLNGALNQTFGGYKGGDFVMGPDTPLWVASYGCCGVAVMSLRIEPDRVMLITKDVDA